MTTGLPDFFKYNLWANLRLLDACIQLSDEQLDANMIGTLAVCERPLCTCLVPKKAMLGH